MGRVGKIVFWACLCLPWRTSRRWSSSWPGKRGSRVLGRGALAVELEILVPRRSWGELLLEGMAGGLLEVWHRGVLS